MQYCWWRKLIPKVCEKMENNSTLGKVLWLVGATFDSKVAFLRRMRKKKFDDSESLRKVCNFLLYLFITVDVWVVKYQLKVFGKL